MTQLNEDWTYFDPDDRFVVDVGRIDLMGPATHETRDGFPMAVLYSTNHGYLVAVQTA